MTKWQGSFTGFSGTKVLLSKLRLRFCNECSIKMHILDCKKQYPFQEGRKDKEHWQKMLLVLTWFKLNAEALPLLKCAFTRQGL